MTKTNINNEHKPSSLECDSTKECVDVINHADKLN